ncbi:MAG: LamG domain-containing protein, partial [Lentisphaerae bacterium]|nr:LamG domain-containing protein [Lentisphaerota bacterium]
MNGLCDDMEAAGNVCRRRWKGRRSSGVRPFLFPLTRAACRLPLWLSVAAVLLVPSFLQAVEPRTWPLDNPDHYTVSDADDIEVADGVGRLKLNDLSFYQVVPDDYDGEEEGDAEVELMHAGPLGLVELVQSGGIYAGSGTFLSRVFEKPSGSVWRMLDAAVGNAMLLGAAGEIPSDHDGLMALYHLDGNLSDATGGAGALSPPAGSLIFNPGRIGSGSLFIVLDRYATVPNANLLHGASEFTISVWAKADSFEKANDGIVFCRSDQPFGMCFNRTEGAQNAYARMGLTFGVAPVKLNAGQWYNFVMVYDGTKVEFYIDADMAASFPFSGSVVQGKNILLGRDTLYGADGSLRDFDELAIWNRALSAYEILQLYLRLRSVKFYARSGDSLPLGGDFAGPDGTMDTFYDGVLEPFAPSDAFNQAHDYAQYMAAFESDANQENTPSLESVTMVTSLGYGPGDYTVADFSEGDFSNVTNVPGRREHAFLGLAKQADGGYPATGTYQSRIINAGTPVTWTRIEWKPASTPLESGIDGLAGLYHLDGSWSDASGRNHPGSASATVTYTENAKVGRRSCRFDGTSAQVSIDGLGDVRTLEFWLRAREPAGGMMTFTGGTNVPIARVSLRNGWVETSGFTEPVTVYVNASSASPKLHSGWNHVALTLESGMGVTNLLVGVAGDRLRMDMDEMAVYDRTLTAGEIAAHYTYGHREIAGKALFSLRAANTEDGVKGKSFTGNFNDPAGSDLFGYAGQYVQYRVQFTGDGAATPGIYAVDLAYNVVNTNRDDSAEEFGLGTFVDDKTRYYGDQLALTDLGQVGPFGTRTAGDATWRGLWQMESETWGPGDTVLDSSGEGRHGTPS